MAKKTQKQLREERQAKIDADNRIFWLYEFIQRAENGGSPVPNEANLGHGEPVYVVRKRELMEFMASVRPMVDDWTYTTEHGAAAAEALQIIDRVLAEDQFVVPLRKLGTPKSE